MTMKRLAFMGDAWITPHLTVLILMVILWILKKKFQDTGIGLVLVRRYFILILDRIPSSFSTKQNVFFLCFLTNLQQGFKGRKREEGLDPTLQKPYKDGGGCIVSQEQINAWLHINGQKSCARGVVKPPCSDMEYDFRVFAWLFLICYHKHP